MVNCSSTLLRVVIVYRPPSTSYGLFFDEFSCLLEKTAAASGSLLVVGDFNLHVNDEINPAASQFVQLETTHNRSDPKKDTRLISSLPGQTRALRINFLSQILAYRLSSQLTKRKKFTPGNRKQSP